MLLRAKEAAVLSCSHRIWFAPSLLLLALLGSFADASESKPTPKQIAQWIEQLGDNDFKLRENASKQLWLAGAAAEAALEKARTSDDREVARRARDLLEKFRWGIYPDTPADIVALIGAYQTSEGKTRMEIFQKLLDSGEPGLLAVLKIAAADPSHRRMMAEVVAQKLPGAFLLAATEGKHAYFERLLELGHERKFIGHNPYAAYYLLRGKLPERIAHISERLHADPSNWWLAQTLVYLHRANGDLVQARRAAEKSARPEILTHILYEGILYELGDWKSLAERANSTEAEKSATPGMYYITGAANPAEKWAYRAAFARLAGKHKEFDNAVRELRKCAEDKHERDSLAFVAAKGLLLNDRPADGLELLRTVPEHRVLHFDVLCARLEFAAALDLAVKEIPQSKEAPSLDLARARLLCLLGEKEGEALFDRYAERIKEGVDPEWVQLLLKEELRAGLKDRAFAHTAKAIGVAVPLDRRGMVSGEHREQIERAYLAQLFPQRTETAHIWWAWLRRKFEGESPAEVINRLRKLMEGKSAAKEVKARIEEAEHLVSMPPKAYSEAWRQALAEVAAKAGLDDLARSLLEKAESRDALLLLGDLFAAKKQWMKAAESYKRAQKKRLLIEMLDETRRGVTNGRTVQESPDPLSLYLAGDTLVRGGQEQEGRMLIEQAHWIPFANATERDRFVRDLIQRGHNEAARRENELLLRISEPNTLSWAEALGRRAIAAQKRKDYLKAADGFEQSMLNCMHASTSYVSTANYIHMPARIHYLRASGLLAAGKLDEALQQAELALLNRPGYIDVPIALVPELERRGRKKEATDLFNRCYSVYEKVCRVYPRCAETHNSAAWLSACCRRNLDAALQHAQKAVELAPTYAGYLDTLAEVHFQRGDKDKAVAVQKHAIELDPKKTYFRKQLKRLEAGDPSAERPPENDD